MEPKSTARLSFLLASAIAIAIAALLATPAAHADTIDWDGDTSVTWATGVNWAGDSAPDNLLSGATADIARFNLASYSFQPTATSNGNINGLIMGASSGAITITTTATTNRLNIGNGGNGGIVMDAGTGTLDIGTVAGTTQGVTLGASQSWTNNSSSLLTVRSVANDANVTPFTLTLDGSGRGGTTISNIIANGGATGTTALIVNMSGTGVVTLSGAIALNQGTLVATVAGAFGTSANTLTFGGGNLELRNTTATTFTGKLNMTTAGTAITVNRAAAGAGVTHVISGASTLGGGQTMVISAGSFTNIDTAYGLTLSAASTLSGNYMAEKPKNSKKR